MFPRSVRFDQSVNVVPGPGEYDVDKENALSSVVKSKKSINAFGTSKRFDKTFDILQDMSAVKNRRVTTSGLGTPEVRNRAASLTRHGCALPSMLSQVRRVPDTVVAFENLFYSSSASCFKCFPAPTPAALLCISSPLPCAVVAIRHVACQAAKPTAALLRQRLIAMQEEKTWLKEKLCEAKQARWAAASRLLVPSPSPPPHIFDGQAPSPTTTANTRTPTPHYHQHRNTSLLQRFLSPSRSSSSLTPTPFTGHRAAGRHAEPRDGAGVRLQGDGGRAAAGVGGAVS
jgi:hypothetical protein